MLNEPVDDEQKPAERIEHSRPDWKGPEKKRKKELKPSLRSKMKERNEGRGIIELIIYHN